MNYHGVIFDFNGTLYWDTPLHDLAFDIFLEKHGISLTAVEKKEKIHRKNGMKLSAKTRRRRLSRGAPI